MTEHTGREWSWIRDLNPEHLCQEDRPNLGCVKPRAKQILAKLLLSPWLFQLFCIVIYSDKLTMECLEGSRGVYRAIRICKTFSFHWSLSFNTFQLFKSRLHKNQTSFVLNMSYTYICLVWNTQLWFSWLGIDKNIGYGYWISVLTLIINGR